MNIEEAPQKSISNRFAIHDNTECGCYFCLRTFNGSMIQTWVVDKGQTALCPHCEMDSVLPDVTDKETLQAACERWFCKPA